MLKRSTTLVRASLVSAILMVLPFVPISADAASFTDVKVPNSGATTEPGIDIGPDGTIFVNGPLGVGGHSALWRSDNGGTSYTRQYISLPWSQLPGGGDGDVVVGADRHVFFMDLYLGSNSIVRSENNGVSWVEGSPVSTLPVSDRQWIGLGKKDPTTGRDTVYAAYANVETGLMFARSSSGGLVWDYHHGVPGVVGRNASAGQLVSSGDKVAIVFEQNGNQYVATSTNAGSTFTVNDVTYDGFVNNGDIAPLAMDGDKLYTAWTDRRDYSVWIARSLDFGETWGAPTHITTGGNSNAFPWLDARGGKVAVVWYGANKPGKPGSVPASTVWSLQYLESTDSGSSYSAPVTVNADVKQGAICQTGITCTSGRELGDFMQVAVHPTSKMSFIAYMDASGTVSAYVARQTG